MKKAFALLAAVVLLCLGNLAQADVFNLGAGYANLEMVTVGDARNVADSASHSGNPAGQGSVSYTYSRIRCYR